MNYQSLKSEVFLINSQLNFAQSRIQIQRLFATPWHTVMQVRSPGSTKFLYLGMGSGHEEVLLGDIKPESELRIKTKFLEFLRKHVQNKKILSVEIDSNDRIVCLNFQSQNEISKLFLFYKGRELLFFYFTLENNKLKFIHSKTGRFEKSENEFSEISFSIFDEWGRNKKFISDSTSVEINHNEEIEKIFIQLKEKAKSKKILHKKEKKLQKKLQNIRDDLKNVEMIDTLSNYASDVEQLSKLEVKTKLCGIKFDFTRCKHIYDRRDVIFERIKKLKKSKFIIQERLQDTKDELESLSSYSVFDLSEIKVIQPKWESNIQKLPLAPQHPDKLGSYFEYESLKFGIGKNASENDYLRIKWASKNDLWFHLEGDKGAHLIIKTDKIDNISRELFQILAAALVEYSGFNYTQASLMYTLVTALKGIKGRKGALIPKKVKYITVDCDLKWKEKISRV
ncbi:MAG: DUF814 domain-containing protein [Halobacteriovoraceae bacterium]|nr:DUF814 domain-containing protein [Halobacteriovoraceae bacterium]